MPQSGRTKSAREIWETAKGALQVQVNKANYDTWLKDTVGVGWSGGQFVVGTPKAFAREWLERRLCSLIRKTLIRITGQDVEVTFQVLPVAESGAAHQPQATALEEARQSQLPLSGVNSRYTFESFVVGKSNRLAFAAAVGVAEEPGVQHNPLYIHGECGVGKTHLAQAIGNEACRCGMSVGYASGEQFTTGFVESIRHKNPEEFQRKCRSVDMLIIEDVQFVEGKRQTQSTLFHIVDELHNTNRQVVVTANKSPSAMLSMDKALSSRLQCGLVTTVHPPDAQTRVSILRLKAQRAKVAIDQAVFDFVAQACDSNVRELEGHLNRLIACAKLSRNRLSLEMAQEALAELSQGSPREGAMGLTPISILHAVAGHYGVTLESLQGRKRESQLVLARQVAVYLIREKTNHPLQEIGRLLGGRNHSTILRSYHQVADTLPADPHLRRSLDEILGTVTA